MTYKVSSGTLNSAHSPQKTELVGTVSSLGRVALSVRHANYCYYDLCVTRASCEKTAERIHFLFPAETLGNVRKVAL